MTTACPELLTAHDRAILTALDAGDQPLTADQAGDLSYLIWDLEERGGRGLGDLLYLTHHAADLGCPVCGWPNGTPVPDTAAGAPAHAPLFSPDEVAFLAAQRPRAPHRDHVLRGKTRRRLLELRARVCTDPAMATLVRAAHHAVHTNCPVCGEPDRPTCTTDC